MHGVGTNETNETNETIEGRYQDAGPESDTLLQLLQGFCQRLLGFALGVHRSASPQAGSRRSTIVAPWGYAAATTLNARGGEWRPQPLASGEQDSPSTEFYC